MAASSPRRYRLLLTAAFLWMAFIFYKSSQTYQQQNLIPLFSSEFSASSLSKWLPHITFLYDGTVVTWHDPYGMLEFFIRKAGHVSEYTILALLLGYSLLAKPLKRSKVLVYTTMFSILYAASDEWHQTFVPGRTGHAIDVAVDTIGILLAVGWFLLTFKRSI
ncbi:VanZ family protein [Paenibacillus sp. GP183]|uniref:VanZ family protein n=1 Tax=Paenibacillus sp. GP183 TaxID=1882751 RepID=UPI00089577AE|nr:VanZ family protein [Paenibacillus sp. GP183]SEB79356.1 VanZ like family protein [Paenibacillus sp. GP183]